MKAMIHDSLSHICFTWRDGLIDYCTTLTQTDTEQHMF